MSDDELLAAAYEVLRDSWATRSIPARLRSSRADRDFAAEMLRLAHRKAGGDQRRFRAALRDFTAFSEEFVILQTELDQRGRYRYASFDEVRAAVYDDSGVMEGRYLNGLLLSTALWANHARIFRYFVERFCAPGRASGSLLEVPSGTGIFVAEFARRNAGWSCRGIDLSPSSVEFGRAIARLHAGPNVRIERGDVFALPDEPAFDRIVCGELLEHVEQPGLLLEKLAAAAAPGAELFLTTAIWTAAIDHIHLFRSAHEVRDLLRRFFTIESELVLNVREQRGPDESETPINYACVLTPRAAR